MTTGERPEEEGGHGPVNLSLNKMTRDLLDKVESNKEKTGVNRSKFVESALYPTATQIDPGPAAEVIDGILGTLSDAITMAVNSREYDKANALSWVAGQISLPAALSQRIEAPEETEAARVDYLDRTYFDGHLALYLVHMFNIYRHSWQVDLEGYAEDAWELVMRKIATMEMGSIASKRWRVGELTARGYAVKAAARHEEQLRWIAHVHYHAYYIASAAEFFHGSTVDLVSRQFSGSYWKDGPRKRKVQVRTVPADGRTA